jgi:hypothetical protein
MPIFLVPSKDDVNVRTHFTQINMVVDNIDITLRNLEPGSTTISISGSVPNYKDEEGNHAQLTNPIFNYELSIDYESSTAEQDVIQSFYNHPKLSEIMDYYRTRFNHLT